MEECCILLHSTCTKSLPSALSSDRPRAWRFRNHLFTRPTYGIHSYNTQSQHNTHTLSLSLSLSLSFSHVAILDLRSAPASLLLPFPIPTSPSIYCVISSHGNAHSLYLRVPLPRLRGLAWPSPVTKHTQYSYLRASSSLVPRIALSRVQEREIHTCPPPPGPAPRLSDCLVAR